MKQVIQTARLILNKKTITKLNSFSAEIKRGSHTHPTIPGETCD